MGKLGKLFTDITIGTMFVVLLLLVAEKRVLRSMLDWFLGDSFVNMLTTIQ